MLSKAIEFGELRLWGNTILRLNEFRLPTLLLDLRLSSVGFGEWLRRGRRFCSKLATILPIKTSDRCCCKGMREGHYRLNLSQPPQLSAGIMELFPTMHISRNSTLAPLLDVRPSYATTVADSVARRQDCFRMYIAWRS